MYKYLSNVARTLLIAVTGTVTLGLGALAPVNSASAQSYPDGPVQIIVSYGAGGGTDRIARLLADPLSKALGQPVTVQNLAGAGGQVAASALLREKADGRTIVATNMPDLHMGPTINNAPYSIQDFQIVMVDLVDPRVLLVKKDSEISSLADFVEKARANPGEVTVSLAQGSAQEIFAKWLFGKLGLDIRVVGYQGGSAAANAVLAGEVVATVGDDFARFNLRDEVRALLVVGTDKSPRWPEAETLTTAVEPYGIVPPSADFLARYGVFVVPAAFKAEHPEDYAELQDAMIAAIRSETFAAYVAENGIEDLMVGAPGEDFAERFAAGTEAVKEIAQ